MSDQSNRLNVQGHEGFLERIIHRHEDQHRKDKSESHPKDGEDHGRDEHKHKEGEMDKFDDHLSKDKDKFEDYLRKDTELESEGDHYGGLM